MSTEIQPERRRYEKRVRAAKEEETRMRILEAALELHGSLGPSRTSISAIAERAGVRRATVYRHFPDERALFLGCSGLHAERNPAPDPALWASIHDPAVRLEAALGAMYAWYERVEPMLTAVIRDVEAMPIVAELAQGQLAYLAYVEDGLVVGWGARGAAARRLRAAIGLALDFTAWRTLHQRGVSRTDTLAVMSAAVRASAGR